MIENFKIRKKIKINNIDEIEDEEDILIAEERLKNSESMKNRIPFEKVLEKFNITQQEIDNVEKIELD